MDDPKRNPEYSYVNSSSAVPVSAPEAPLTWRDAAAPAAAVVLALLYWRTFALEVLSAADAGGPGLGIPVFAALYFAAVFLMLGRRRSPGGLALMAGALALALSCALYAHWGFTILNCFGILALSAMATFALSGQARHAPFSLRAIPEAVVLSVMALFTRIDRPFKAAGRAGKDHRGGLGRALLALLGTLVLLGVVLALLASADMVFGSFFDGLRHWLEAFALDRFLWRTARAFVLAMFIASGLCFIREPAPPVRAAARPPRERHALPFLPPVLLLDLVYALFCAVQLRYLFGGAEAAAMAGGWAEYARTGFFQLVAVAAINLLLAVGSGKPDRLAAKGGPILRWANALLLLLTALILVSAWYRMRLYVNAFGLSVLRLMTLWGMLVIAAGLLLAGWKLYRPAFAFTPAFLGFALGTWCLLCLSGPAGRIADYNVDAYLDGRLPSVDVWYLEELSADAAPALRRLSAAAPEYHQEAETVLDRFADEILHHPSPWTQWKLSYIRIGKR